MKAIGKPALVAAIIDPIQSVVGWPILAMRLREDSRWVIRPVSSIIGTLLQIALVKFRAQQRFAFGSAWLQ